MTENVLERAKAEGIKVSKDGKMVLPGNLKPVAVKGKKEKVVKEKAVKAPRVKKEPVVKPFVGFKSDIFSTGPSKAVQIADALRNLSSVIGDSDTWKISTYKDELRVSFENRKASDIIKDENIAGLGEWSIVKDIFVIKIK